MYLHNTASRRGFKDMKTIDEYQRKLELKQINLRTLRRFLLPKGPSSLDPGITGTGAPVSWRGTSGPTRSSMAIKLITISQWCGSRIVLAVLDPDPYWECGSGSRRTRKKIEEKNNKTTWFSAFQKDLCTLVFHLLTTFNIFSM
jgi:hypothetical protein